MKKIILSFLIFLFITATSFAATGEIKKVSGTGGYFVINLGQVNGIKVGSTVQVFDDNNEKIMIGEVEKVEKKSALVKVTETLIEGKKLQRGLDIVVKIFETDEDFVKSFEEGKKPTKIKTFYDTGPYLHNFSVLFGTYGLSLDGFGTQILYAIKFWDGFIPQIADPFYFELGLNIFYYNRINAQITGVTPKYLGIGLPFSIRWDLQVWEYLTIFILGGGYLNFASMQISNYGPNDGFPVAAAPKGFYFSPVARLGLSVNITPDIGVRVEGSWDTVALGVVFRF